VEGGDNSLFTHPCTIGNKDTLLTALIDTCAMGGNFIHFQTAQILCKTNGISLRTLRNPIQVQGFNGQSAPAITHKLTASLQIGRHSQPTCDFLVTDLGRNDLIIGNKWLKEHGAIPVPITQEIWFIGGHCRHSGAPPIIPLPNEPQSQEGAKAPIDAKAPLEAIGAYVQEGTEAPLDANGAPFMKKRQRQYKPKLTPNQKLRRQEVDRIANAPTLLRRSIRCTLPTVVEEDEAAEYYESWEPVNKPIQIALIGAYAMSRQIRRPENQIMAISMEDIMAQHDKDSIEEQDPKALLPEELRRWAYVFSGKAANTLPPHRIGVDHHIELLLDKRPNWTPRFYRSTQEEMEELKRWVTENLSRGFIEASKCPWASPIMFVRKPGGGVRLCIDYRQLNEITRKDRYPIPLIEETMANVAGSKIMTKLDIRKAFNRIRIATPKDEDLLTFCTPFGNYKPKVLQFGPTNGPASFQRFINDTLFDFLNVFCTAYMDDILIYSQSQEEHTKHVQMILQRLGEANLQADISKSEFNVTKTKFLGLIVSTEGIEINPDKIKVVQEWKAPSSVTEAQSFIGFCNFYRRFIRGFSKIARPIIELTKDEFKKNFQWNGQAQEAFDELKRQITSAPILAHFDHSKMSYLEADSSDYVQGGCLSQMKDGVLHPVAFFSRKLSPAECNYEIYDKELLAIVNALEQWRPELEGTELPIQVLTDHKALEYFMSTKKLTRRQARWALTLSKYNFQITYRPGKQNGKADALTRKPGDRPEGDNDERQRYQFQTILPARRLHPTLRQELKELAHQSEFQEPPTTLAPILAQEPNDDYEDDEDDELPELLETRVKAAQLLDSTCIRVLAKLVNEERHDVEVTLAHASVKEGALYIDDKLWVPDSVRTEVIQAIHDSQEVGHPGLAKTLFHLKKSYYWPNMHLIVAQYLRNCHNCRRAKTSRDKYHGLLNPLQLADRPWRHISMDFVVKLPQTKKGYNCMAVIVCRLTKRQILEPMVEGDKGTSAEETAKLVYLNMRRQGVGMIDSFVSDRGPQWDCEFWAHLCRLWKIKRLMSTAFHPQTDGQTEIVNQETERFIRTYTNYQQDDWDTWLPEAEAAMNANPSATTGISPFFATNGYEPRMSFDLRPELAPLPPKDARKASERRRAERVAKAIQDRAQYLQEQITLAQSRMEQHSNANRQPSPSYQPRDKVWLSLKNIATQRPSKKFDDRNVLCEVLRRVGRDSYELKLPEGMTSIHPVFHTSLLRPDPNDPLPGQHVQPQPPVLIPDEGGDLQEHWEVESIVDSRYSYGFLEYKVKWKDYPMERRKWYRATLFNNATDSVRDFHNQYPEKPAPRPDGLRIRQSELNTRVQTQNNARQASLATRRSSRLDLTGPAGEIRPALGTNPGIDI